MTILGTYSGVTYEPGHTPKPQRKPHKATVQPAEVKPMCSRCGFKPAHALGRCVTCTKYWNRYGVERPYTLIERARDRKRKPLWCQNCAHPKLYAGQRCQTCFRYWKKTGTERPEWKWNPDVCCRNCSYPRKASPMTNGHYRFYVGRCEPCHHYLRDFKRERPKHLWGIGKYGFCLCGRPANHQKDGFDLCTICAEA